MNTEPPNPKSKSTRRGDAGLHPVLARLPDVSEQPLPQPRSNRAASAGFVDYRFDMPAGHEETESRPRLRVQSPAYRRTPRSDSGSRTFGSSSRALPNTNPFAIPATSVLDRLAPAIRFLTLFLLFTAIGTFVLSSIGKRPSEPQQDRTPSAAAPAGVEQRLEPTSNDEHPTIASPQAFGPLGASAAEPDDASTQHVEIAPETTAGGPTATTEPMPSLAGANGEPLPQVQTTEIAATLHDQTGETAAARLTGSIRASDDAPEMTPAKPPAVARRLPTIFEAPRNAYQ